MTQILDGAALAAEIRDDLEAAVDRLTDAGERPGLATVHVGSDRAAARYVELKQRDCQELGIDGQHYDLDPGSPVDRVVDTLERLNDDPSIHGALLQKDVPDHVDWLETVRRIDPEKDVDGVHPENVGRLVAGDPRFVPCTALGIERLLDRGGIDVEGADVVIVNHSNIVGKPLANLLVQKQRGEGAAAGPPAITESSAPDGSAATSESPATAGPVATAGDATVTICHSKTENLAAKTRRADVLVVAVGIPEFVDGSMVTEGTTVVDVGISKVETRDESGYRQVGDVDVDGVEPKVDALTPNPGGVGPMTRAMLQYNTVRAAARRADVDPFPSDATSIPST